MATIVWKKIRSKRKNRQAFRFNPASEYYVYAKDISAFEKGNLDGEKITPVDGGSTRRSRGSHRQHSTDWNVIHEAAQKWQTQFPGRGPIFEQQTLLSG